VNISRNLLFLVLCVIGVLALFHFVGKGDDRAAYQSLSYSEFVSAVDKGDVREVTLKGPVIYGTMRDGRVKQVYAPNDKLLVDRLQQRNVRITVESPDDGSNSFLKILASWLPILLLVGVWIFFMRQMQGGGSKAGGFGKSRAKLLTETTARVTFQDVAGIEEAKKELEEIVEFLKDPKRFQQVGGRIPHGCLLVGAPGTGKTLLARAIAGEAEVPFFSISGSDFVEMFVGVGAARVRDMFEQGKKNAPCIIFVDEIDAVGRHRGAGLGGGNDEREQTLNQLLVEMDGFDGNPGVILIGATNRPDVLDPALLRPGRFDRQVVVPVPDINGREQILKVHARKVNLADSVDLRIIARGAPGFSGAELANLVNEAALIAARGGKRAVAMDDFEAARDKVMMGVERRSLVMTEEDRRITAYHEAGHALVSLRVGGGDPLHKVTIIPRGSALGMTMSLPEQDRHTYSRRELDARLVIGFGGRIAEELVFGRDQVTTGAGNDIKVATALARRMVTEFGFSDRVGRLRYADSNDEVFLGHAITQHRRLSDDMAQTIDEEVRRLIDAAEARARTILEAGRGDLDRLARNLLEFETLTGEEIGRVVAGADIERAGTSPRGGHGDGASVPNSRTPSRDDRASDFWRPRPGPRGSNA
jgi:cell division protease FtsH